MTDREEDGTRLRADRDHLDDQAGGPIEARKMRLSPPMKCAEFIRIRDETLDARMALSPGFPPDFEAHAASCPSCRSVASGYQLLGPAFEALAPPPPASAGSLARLRLLRVPPARPSWCSRHRKGLVRLALAASVLGLASLQPIVWRKVASKTPAARPVSSLPIDAAFASATRATLDLAKAASGPAARLGREAFDLERPPVSPIVAEAEPEAPEGPARLLEAVGRRVNAGVRPISGSARHAFSFLLGPVDEPTPAAPSTRDTL